MVDGFKGEKQAKNNYDELSEREYVEVLINTGLSKKDAIKTVCKERKLKKDVVYKQDIRFIVKVRYILTL